MRIAGLTLENPFVLAPLAGHTDLAFRLLCREYGAGLVFSEMISCHGLAHQQKNTLEMTRTSPAERPVAMQLFGADPAVLGRAAAMLSELPIDLLDINMGCPVKKVTKKGAGCALMNDLRLAERLIKAVCANTDLPVSVKFRSGVNHRNIIAPEFAQMAESAGAAAVTVHGRTWSAGFSGRVDREVIARVKQAVSIPVIGNGDIKSYEEGLAMMAETGCDGVMIGRAALGAPWIFSAGMSATPPLGFRLRALARHLALIKKHHPAGNLARVKNQAGRYFKALPGGGLIRKQIYATKSIAVLDALIGSLHHQQESGRI